MLKGYAFESLRPLSWLDIVTKIRLHLSLIPSMLNF